MDVVTGELGIAAHATGEVDTKDPPQESKPAAPESEHASRDLHGNASYSMSTLGDIFAISGRRSLHRATTRRHR